MADHVIANYHKNVCEYTSNWPASRRARPSTHYMLPSMIFDDFERILHPWHEQSNSGNDKNQRVLMHVRRSIDNVPFWPLQDRHSYFLWLFNGKFSMILSDFCIHGVRKATPVTTKANAFWCNFAGRSTACVFEHCTTWIYFFKCSFRGDLWCILASFCMILCTRLEGWSRYMNGPQSNSKRVISITFWSVFVPEKYRYRWR